MNVKLARGGAQVAVPAISFAQADPRLVLLPVSKADAARLGAKIYRISADPFKFQDVVVAGAQENYYGESKFQIDTKTPAYVKLDRGLLRTLSGNFNPSRSDLVFSRTGELLGIMANNNYCLVLRKFDATSTFNLDQSLRSQALADTLAHYYVSIGKLPAELQ
jgi:predicted ribonuclease YlaK